MNDEKLVNYILPIGFAMHKKTTDEKKNKHQIQLEWLESKIEYAPPIVEWKMRKIRKFANNDSTHTTTTKTFHSAN